MRTESSQSRYLMIYLLKYGLQIDQIDPQIGRMDYQISGKSNDQIDQISDESSKSDDQMDQISDESGESDDQINQISDESDEKKNDF